MTKRDGDKLRKMRDDLVPMAQVYEQDSDTQVAMVRISVAIELALRGQSFRVVRDNVRVRR